MDDTPQRGGNAIGSHSLRGMDEKASGAYKDIDAVAQASERARLAQRVAALRPLICMQG